jgi:hypothetical protein
MGAQSGYQTTTGRTVPCSANRPGESDRLPQQLCRTRDKKRGEFAGGGAGVAPSARWAWRSTDEDLLQYKRRRDYHIRETM